MLREKTINTKSGRVFYWVTEPWHPERSVLVFLHGLTADHTMFAPQISHFAPKYNLLLWDAPAHGKSRPYPDFSFEASVEVLRQMLEENGVASAVLIGQSMGGHFAQSFLDRYPERVQGFVGIDTTPYGTRYYSKSDLWWLRQVEWMAHLCPINMLKKAMASQVSRTEAGRFLMLEMLRPYGKDELCHLMGTGYAGFLEDNREVTIRCPSLLILGEHDKTGKVKQYNRMWHEQTGIPLVRIPNAAHNANVDNPKAVNGAIADFLSESACNPERVRL